jgi:O-acetyl-ADP-ribose deacetylase (regulator of RNase III)
MKFMTGNLLDADVQALVNTVNTKGVMGKGIALLFKEAYPQNYAVYVKACRNGDLVPGKLLVVKEATLSGEKIIINFPTKTDWHLKSRYEYIDAGLKELVNIIRQFEIKSIAIPPLGCGNGGLLWSKVRAMIEKHLGKLKDVEVRVYEPTKAVKDLLKMRESKTDIYLTPPRGMLLYAMFYYESMDEQVSLFTANKLAYLLQRLGENSLSRLKFGANYYGPYSVQVQHLLHAVNGKYIKGLEQMDVKPFDPLEMQYNRKLEVSEYVRTKLTIQHRDRLKNLIHLIDGFQSTLSLEILATVDFIRKEHQEYTKEDIMRTIQNWSERKGTLIKSEYVDIALNRLDECALSGLANIS